MHLNVQGKETRQVLVPFPKDRARRALERNAEDRLEKAIEACRRAENAAALLPEFITLINLGCSEANYFAACLLEEGGPDLPQDMKSAVFYYQKAVEEIGYLEAALALARIYFYGIGVPVDSELAAQYYNAILTLEPHPIASLMLGRMYRLGEGVTKDLKRAEELLVYAANADNVYAIRELAMLRRQQGRWILALLLGLKAGWRAFRIGLQDLHDPRLRQA
jgi:TPR repeat protein